MLARKVKVSIGALTVVACCACTSSALAADRHATPGGSGSACTSGAPCSALVAVEGASAEDEVIIHGGTHNLGATQVDLTVDATVRGAAGEPRVLLVSTAVPSAFAIDSADAEVRDVIVRNEGAGNGIAVFDSGGTVERVGAQSTASNTAACSIGAASPGVAILRDSLCRTTGTNSQAVATGAGSSGPGILVVTADLINVTAIAEATGSIGVGNFAGGFTDSTTNARNVIAQGPFADAAQSTTATDIAAAINFSSSNYNTESDPDGAITDPGTGTNQTELPLYVDPVGPEPDYRQLPGSPTINAGLIDPDLGTRDLDGAQRVQGPQPDIGAFEHDEIAPTASITSGPGEGETIATSTATFGFTASEPATFRCSVDGGAFALCSGPGDSHTATGLADGPHTFSVMPVDSASNAGAAVTRNFTVSVPTGGGDGGGGDGGGDGGGGDGAVDRRAPLTTITKRPKNRTDKESAKFKFSADEPGSTFECKLDRKRFRSCTSPRRYRNLDEAKHRFLVRATDAAGNTGAAVKDRWKVVD